MQSVGSIDQTKKIKNRNWKPKKIFVKLKKNSFHKIKKVRKENQNLTGKSVNKLLKHVFQEITT